MPKKYLVIVGALVLVIILGFLLKSFIGPSAPSVEPTPAPEAVVEQLPSDKHPKIEMSFSADAHYVTVDITNIHADQLEYNLIYDAVVKKNLIQTGVNASAKLEGATTYSQRQLLGSESSGKFTYHDQISNAVLELTLRDMENRSIFTSTYPFTVTPGETMELSPAQ